MGLEIENEREVQKEQAKKKKKKISRPRTKAVIVQQATLHTVCLTLSSQSFNTLPSLPLPSHMFLSVVSLSLSGSTGWEYLGELWLGCKEHSRSGPGSPPANFIEALIFSVFSKTPSYQTSKVASWFWKHAHRHMCDCKKFFIYSNSEKFPYRRASLGVLGWVWLQPLPSHLRISSPAVV